MNIHNILKVYKRDWKSIIKNPVAMVIIAGLCVIPSLYAWVNIKACWNTYENTSTIPVAVVNNDKEADFNGKKINIGNEVIEKLKDNHKIGWKFVNSKEADLGLVDGTYYAMIEIPEDFSASFLSVLSDKPKKPQITYKVDTKVNPVAGKITQVAKNTLVDEITANFVSTVNETIFSSLNNVGKNAEKNKENIIKMKDSIININSNMGIIVNSLQSVNSNSSNLSLFLSSIKETMPSVQNSLGVIAKNNSDNEAIIKSAQTTMNSSIDNINISLKCAQASNDRIQGLFKKLNESVSEANTSKINSIIPEINLELSSLNDSIDVTIDYLQVCNSIDFNADIAKTVTSLKNLQTSLNDIKKQLQDIQKTLKSASGTVDEIYKVLSTELPKLIEQMDNLNKSIGSMITILEDYNKTLNDPNIAQLINSLKQMQVSLSNLQNTLKSVLANLDKTTQSIKDTIAALDNDITNIIKEIDKLNVDINNAVSFLQKVSTTNTGNKAQISSIIQSLKAIKPYINDEKSQLGKIQKQLNSVNLISKSIADSVNNDISNISTQLISASQKYNSEVKKDLNSIADNLIIAAEDASDLIKSAQNLGTDIDNLMSLGIDGSNLALKFSGDLSSRLLQFKDVIKQLSDKLQLVSNNDIVQIISIFESNPKFMGDFMSSPIELKDQSINEIPNYGSSMAPIYSVLALWVGCLLLNSILKTDVGYFDGIEKLTLREKHFGKMLIYTTLAMIQGLIISVGDKLIVHVYTVNTPLLIVFAVVSSLTFSIITYTLASTLGNIGKALGIIYMILQLAGSGGTYPIQVDPKIFRILQPLFPFTYSVGGFREAIAGPLVSSVVLDFVALFIFAAVFLLFGFFFKEPLYKRIHGFEVKFKESGIGE